MLKKTARNFNMAALVAVIFTLTGCAALPYSQLLTPEMIEKAKRSPIAPDVITAGWSQSPHANNENFADPGTFWVEGTWYLDKEKE